VTGALPQEPVHAEHGGILYAGEVVRAESWRAELGDPLVGDASFRVVFLESPASVAPGAFRDARIAVYVPGQRPPELSRAETELRALRETQSLFVTGPRETLDQQPPALAGEQAAAEDRVVAAWAESFRAGRIIAAPPIEADLAFIFADGYWSTWAERIGLLLLRGAYRDPPLNASLLRLPLRPEQDAPVLLEAVLGGTDGAAGFAMDAFATGLGIASAVASRVPDLARCATIDLIASMAADGQDAAAIGHTLAHERGLTYPLATLYLLLTVVRENVELVLDAGHALRKRDGTPFAGERIVADDLPTLAWPADLWTHVAAIQQRSPHAKKDPYEAAVSSDPESWLAEVGREIDAVERALAGLANAQGGAPPELLRQLRSMAECDGTLAECAEHVFGDPGAFAAAARTWEGWTAAITQAVPLTEAIETIRRAVLLESAGEIYFERDVLGRRLHDPALLTEPRRWASLAEDAERFVRRYAQAYVTHHGAYHTEVARLSHQVDDVARQARALERLNRLSDLGAPLGGGLSALAAQPTVESTERDPVCHACGILLGQSPPTAETAEIAGYVGDALGAQSRRLAGAVARRLAGRESHERLDRFVQVVQVADLSALANVLDDDLLAFVGDLLRESPAKPGAPSDL
jgi:hypothetical protein